MSARAAASGRERTGPGVRAVAVVIPTWNGREMLRECLQSLAGQTFDDFEVRVVDNGSTDGTREMLAGEFPEVRTLLLRRNVGFAAAVNAGINAGAEPLVAALNNDARAEPAWLEELVTRANAECDAGFFASVIVLADDPGTVDSAGLTLRRDGTPRLLFGGRPAAAVPDGPSEVFGASAGAALYRRSMLDDIGTDTGPFDERFFAYGEDVDLSLRARLAGHRCVLVPSARVIHRHMGTSRRTPSLVPYLHYRNIVLYLLKHMPYGWLARRLPGFALSGLRPLLMSPWRGEGWAILLARFGVLKHAPHALRERRRLRPKRRVPFDEVARMFGDGDVDPGAVPAHGGDRGA